MKLKAKKIVVCMHCGLLRSSLVAGSICNKAQFQCHYFMVKKVLIENINDRLAYCKFAKMKQINIGRQFSGGIFNGLFGNPVKEKTVTKQYRQYLRAVIQNHSEKVKWLKEQLEKGAILYCPGCGIDSPTCHARIIEEEIAK